MLIFGYKNFGNCHPKYSRITKSNMNQKTYSILFCALLASSFIHELTAKDHQNHHDRSHGDHGHWGHLGRHNRANESGQDCQWVCGPNNGTEGGTGDLKIVVNINASIIAVYNSSANVGIAIDISANIVAIFNGNTGDVIVIDLETQTGVYLTAKITATVWLVAKISFSEYVSKLTSLKGFLEVSGGVKFSVKSITKAVLKIVNEIVVKLISGIKAEIDNDAKVGIKILIKVVIKLRAHIVAYYSGSLTVFEEKEISLNVDLVAFVSIVEGVGIVIHEAGDLSVLIQKGFRLDVGLWQSGSGSVILVNLLLKLHNVNIDIAAVYGKWLNNSASLLILIGIIGGGTSAGSSGESAVVIFIAHVIAKLKGENVSIEVLVARLLSIVITAGAKFNLTLFIESLKGLLEVIKLSAKYASELKELAEFIEVIVAGKLIIASINISKILINIEEAIRTEVTKRLVIIVQIAVTLGVVPALLLAICVSVGTVTGIAILAAVGIEIAVTLVQIVQEVVTKSPQIIGKLLVGDIIGALKQISIFNAIITAVEKVLAELNLQISAYLKQLGEYIKAMFSVLFKIGVSASSDATTKVQKSLSYVSCGFVFGIDVQYSFSAGGGVVFAS